MAAFLLLPLLLLLRLTIVYVLVRKYLRTRDTGFVWLGVAVIIWPFISGLLGYGEKILATQITTPYSTGPFPFNSFLHEHLTPESLFTLVSALQQSIAVGLLLIAVLNLYKKKPGKVDAAG